MSSTPPRVAVPSGGADKAPLPQASSRAQAAADTTGMKWTALHEAAGAIATLAGLEEERASAEIDNFPEAIRDTAPWRREAAEAAIADLAAIMEPGIAALLTVSARGTDVQAPALALWQEFRRARAALLALAPPSTAPGAERVS